MKFAKVNLENLAKEVLAVDLRDLRALDATKVGIDSPTIKDATENALEIANATLIRGNWLHLVIDMGDR